MSPAATKDGETREGGAAFGGDSEGGSGSRDVVVEGGLGGGVRRGRREKQTGVL